MHFGAGFFGCEREATEDQHCLGGNGVDYVTNLLVTKHEVDELRDLKVIDGDLGPDRGDDQVFMLRPF